MPTTLPVSAWRSVAAPESVTGKPETRCLRISSRARPMESPGPSVIGSRMMPLAERLTLVTSRACASGERFLWMIPMPPSWASAIARSDSVTLVRRAVTLVSAGLMELARGMSRTSSKVMPSATILTVGFRRHESPATVAPFSEGLREGLADSEVVRVPME